MKKHPRTAAPAASRSGTVAAIRSPGVPSARGGLFPPAAEMLDPRGPFLVPLLILLATRIAAWAVIGGGAEDAYITYRYAHHLASGNGLVYNPGERVMGFSSPLWTIWNALGFLLVKQPLLWSRATSVLADLVTLLALGRLLQRTISTPAAWCFTAFFASWPYFAALAMSGMESSLMLAWIALAASSIAADSPIGGPVLGALALTRPEGVVSAIVLGWGMPWRRRIVGLAIAAAGGLALFLTFGTIVPQSLTAKAAIYGAPGPWAGRYWWDWLLPFALGRRSRVGDTALLTLLSVLLAPAVVLGAREIWRVRRSAVALAALAALAVWAGYVALGVGYFWWYLGVPLGGIALLAAAGFPAIARGRALFVTAALAILGAWPPSYELYVGRWQQESGTFGAAGSYLREQARPGQTAFLEPIGMIGYEAPLRIVDEVGLVSPQVARRRKEGPGWYADVVAAEHPDWLVLRYGVMRTGEAFAGAGAPFRGATERDSTLARYALVQQSDEQPRYQTLMILRRVR